MKKIKTLLRSLTISTNYEKALLKLDSSDQFAVPTQEVILSIQEGIDGTSIEISQDKATKDFFNKLTKHSQHWANAIKLLVISQNLLHLMKLNFAFKFLDHEISNSLKTAIANHSPSDELHIEIAQKYCEFIRGMCRSFKCVYECEQFAENSNLEYLGLKPLDDIIDTLTPLIGILKNLFRVQQSLSFSLQNFQKYTIIKEVARLMIKDSIMIYNFLAKVTAQLTENIISGDNQDSLSIYSVYEDVAMLTKSMDKFYQLRYFTVDEQSSIVNKPQYMIIDIEKNRAIELHINRLKESNKTSNSSNNASSLEIKPQKNAIINNFLAADQQKNNDQAAVETAMNSIQIKQKNKLFSDKSNNNSIGLFSSSASSNQNHNIFGVTSQLKEETPIPTKDIQLNNFFSNSNKPLDSLENPDQSRKRPRKFFLSQNKKLDFDGDTNSNSSGGFLERQSTKNVQSYVPDDYERESIFSQSEVNSNFLSSCQAMNNNNTPSFVSRNFRKSQPESALIRMAQQANIE